MVRRYDDDEPKVKKKKVKVVEEEVKEEIKEEQKLPMVYNYPDLILGELVAIRLMLEKQFQKD